MAGGEPIPSRMAFERLAKHPEASGLAPSRPSEGAVRCGLLQVMSAAAPIRPSNRRFTPEAITQDQEGIHFDPMDVSGLDLSREAQLQRGTGALRA